MHAIHRALAPVSGSLTAALCVASTFSLFSAYATTSRPRSTRLSRPSRALAIQVSVKLLSTWRRAWISAC